MPLEKGLADVSRDLPGRLGLAAEQLGKRLETGENLAQVVAQDKAAFPPIYRAAVVAGLRCGKLAAALEGIASTARRTAELRRVVGYALLYPLLVLGLAYFLFATLSVKILPTFANAIDDMALGDSGLMMEFAKTAARWAQRAEPFVFTVVPALLVLWWFWSGRAVWRGDRAAGGIFGRLPTAGKLLRLGRLATFIDVLALLVEQQVPLAEAILLASDASADRRLRVAGQELAARLAQGSDPGEAKVPAGFPTLLGWMLITGARHDGLVRTLRTAADGYRRQTLRLVEWLTVYLPMILTAVLGGSVVFLYALAMLGPYFQILYDLSQLN